MILLLLESVVTNFMFQPSESWTPDDNGGDSPWGDTDMGNWEGSQETNHSWNIVSGFKKRPSIKVSVQLVIWLSGLKFHP